MLHRAECFDKLIILYAPKLTLLNVQAAYELRDIKIYNCTAINAQTVQTHIFSKITNKSIKKDLLESSIKTLISESEHTDISEPIININTENMEINSNTKQHLKDNKRIKLLKQSGDKSGWNGMEAMMGGMHPFEENNGDSHSGSDEYEDCSDSDDVCSFCGCNREDECDCGDEGDEVCSYCGCDIYECNCDDEDHDADHEESDGEDEGNESGSDHNEDRSIKEEKLI